MRFVAGWLGALWLVVGCTVSQEGLRTCTTDADCGSGGRCDVELELCYASGEEPGTTCTPTCADHEACTPNGCRPRFTELKILSPAPNTVLTGATVEVSAQLVADPTYASTTRFPDTLLFSATREGGESGGSFESVTRAGDTYTVTWTLPAAQAQLTLTAAHPVATAVQSATINVQVETVPPAFTLTFSAPTARDPGSATQADQRDPVQDYQAAYRRDETVTVTVSSNEPASNVTLTVVGIGAGAMPGASRPPISVRPGGTCTGNPPFCGTVTVKLSEPEMRAVRGTMEFRVEGQDAAGNRGSKSEQVKVTRWKWVFEAGAPIQGSPAIGSWGQVYFGTNLVPSASGKFFSLSPEGSRTWEAAVGDVSGSPTVGERVSNDETVYVAARIRSDQYFYALRGSTGMERSKCSYTNAIAVPGALALIPAAPPMGFETAVGIYSGSPVRIVAIRPDEPLSGKCLEISGSGANPIPASGDGSSLVIKDQNIFYGTSPATSGYRITSYDMASGANVPRSGWPQGTTHQTRGLAAVGSSLYGATGNSADPSFGFLFTVPMTGGPLTPLYPSSRIFNLAIGRGGAGDTAYFGAETATSAELLALSLSAPGSNSIRASNVGTLRAAPVLGKNGRLYTLNTTGRVTAWETGSLTELWSVELQLDLATTDTSPTLDCLRDPSGNGVANGSLGTLYFSGGNKLYALVVDSPGMDSNAPWPRYQHDARNTGNPATPVTNCP